MNAALWVTLLTLAAKPDTAKIFTDKGSTYFRSDDKKVLTLGTELVASNDPSGAPAVGTAVIMEVAGALARIRLDEEATKAGAKFVLLTKPAEAEAAPPPPPPPPAPALAPTSLPVPPKLATLLGKVEVGALRVTWVNQNEYAWSQCRLIKSDGDFYDVGDVAKGAADGVMKGKFSSPPAPAYDNVSVECAEGKSDFFFSRPSEPVGMLRGYATTEGKGDIVVYNQTNVSWSACDVRKPDGSHFVLGDLRANDHDNIGRKRFKKEEESPRWVDMRCKEGTLRAPQ